MSQHALLLDSIQDAVVVTDMDGVVTYWNDGATRLYGWSAVEMIGQPYVDRFPEPARSEVGEIIKQLKAGKEYNGEWFDYRKDGSRVWIFTRVSRLIDSNGQAVGIMGVSHDVTARKHTEEALRQSEQRLESLIDSIDGIIWDVDIASFSFTYVSRQAERILGYPVELWLHNPDFWVDRIHPDDRDWAVQFCLDRTAKGEGHEFDYRMLAADGRVVWLHDRVTVETENGKPVRLRGVMVDITDRMKARAELERSLAWLRTILDASRDGIALEDDDRIVFCNQTYAQLYGYERPEELIGQHVSVVQSPEDNARMMEYGERRRRGEPAPPSYEFRGRRRDGSVIHLEASISTTLVGERKLIVAAIRDVSERKAAEDEKRRLEDQVRHSQKLESLGVLAGGIAHDFNNLLTGILGYADLASCELPVGSPALPLIQEVVLAARRAADLTQQMLAYAGRGKFVIGPVQLSLLAKEMLNLLQTVVSKKAHIATHFNPALPIVEGDPTQIRQVVMNLITNASDALENREGTITVATGVRTIASPRLYSPYCASDLPGGEYVFIEVADTGCGMAAETMAHIFDPFFTTKFTGRGLGLAAVLGIVRGHRGLIKVASEPGRGSTFEVLLPAVGENRAVGADAPAVADTWKGRGTLLVVDDEMAVRGLAGLLLEKVGFRVLLASHGREGLDLFEKHQNEIDAVLLDLTMPHLSGLEVARELRLKRADLPILLMSGYSEHELNSQLGAQGIAGFIQKPFLADDLIAAVRRALPG